MTTTTTGVALIKMLEQYNVDHVFGIPGVHTIELYRGLADSIIEHHTPRHEQGAGFMADGYARVSGKPGICFVITGPGLTNIATAMGQALADSIPMLIISSVNDTLQTPHARGMLHEMPNQLAVSQQLTRFSHSIGCAEELPGALARAFDVFYSSRPGPVHLQIPVALLGQPANISVDQSTSPVYNSRACAPQTIAAVIEQINQSHQPIILAGGGSRHAAKEITELAQRVDAPVFMTINARGTVPYDHPLAISASCTLQAARQSVKQADLVLAIGTELSATDYDQYKDDGFEINAPLIRCDIDPMQLNNNFNAKTGICSDSKYFTISLLEKLPAKTPDKQARQRTVQTMQKAKLELNAEMTRHLEILHAMRKAVPDAIFVGDSTQLIYSGNMIFNTAEPNHWFNSSVGFGTLGYALPAATGAAIAAPDKPVICIIGDGGMQFVLGELGALKDSGLPVAVLVWCNKGYREIKTTMENANVSAVGVEFSVPDYQAVARAYGINACAINNEADLCSEIVTAHLNKQPVLIEIHEEEIMGL